MKSILTFLLLLTSVLFLENSSMAQIAITTDGSMPDNSAMLDVKSISKGLLIPRMSTAQRNAITSPAEGLLVYDLTAANFWYYKNGGWNNLVSGWQLTGNGGTNQATNFIGTTDNNPLIFKINGIKSGKIGPASDGNVSLGLNALASNTTGHSNVAFGIYALYSNTNRSNLVAIGDSALIIYGNGAVNYWEAIQNTAVGSNALRSNTIGYANSAYGFQALFLNSSGYQNTAMGALALPQNSAGTNNTAVGYMSMNNITGGSDNTAMGTYSQASCVSGSYNTAVGEYSNYYVTTDDNTSIGYSAGDYYTFSQGTFLGSNAYSSANGFTNCMALGYNARVNASNKVVVGNTSVTSIGGYAGWSNFSDGRYKMNIKDNVPGLSFINLLHPVTYNIDINGLNEDINQYRPALNRDNERKQTVTPAEQESADAKSRIIYTGFIAQEVEEAARSIGYDFSGVDSPQNPGGYYGLRYGDFVVPLVKAVQEQQAIINSQQKQIDELLLRVNELEKEH